jgi:predicted PurR-regulated permease PerM
MSEQTSTAPTLGPRQRATVGAAVTIVSGLIIVGAVLGLAWLIAAFVNRFASVLMPLAVAGVAAMVVRPYFLLLRERLNLSPVLALLAVLASIALPAVAFLFFFGAVAVGQLSDLIARLPEAWAATLDLVHERWPRVRELLEQAGLTEKLGSAGGGSGAMASSLKAMGGRALSAGAQVMGAVGALFAWAVLPVYFAFFLLMDLKGVRSLDDMLPFLKEDTRKDVHYLLDQFVDIVVAFFRGQLLIALMQGLLYAVGFSVIGLRYGFVLGLVLGLLNVIPYLGSIVGLGVGLPLAYFQQGGGTTTLVLMLLVFTVVQAIEGYVLTPKIMGDRTGLHPMAIIVAVFFWGSALSGIMGMILAIPLTAFLVVFWRLAREKYIHEIV